ncbi:uncharacterized protein BT62DRAFT_1013396 [Guyanagaster necrorhizus]|uniref:Uncharacterized protein n=1 Tax=Guyanagaster necrorhizus TaxID=856835 RepID=A0A9P7VFY2_9AGAR|nr:uncharacterized protein BT62DRAFT_1013396 [Guyanagaster necrorhizus MCA 3950]KAG7439853.1 hypothetical protein BT62DRAFT_1013396 [Guyanagaster necrorhizus MCA 3950]
MVSVILGSCVENRSDSPYFIASLLKHNCVTTTKFRSSRKLYKKYRPRNGTVDHIPVTLTVHGRFPDDNDRMNTYTAVFWVIGGAHGTEPHPYPQYISTVLRLRCTFLRVRNKGGGLKFSLSQKGKLRSLRRGARSPADVLAFSPQQRPFTYPVFVCEAWVCKALSSFCFDRYASVLVSGFIPARLVPLWVEETATRQDIFSASDRSAGQLACFNLNLYVVQHTHIPALSSSRLRLPP